MKGLSRNVTVLGVFITEMAGLSIKTSPVGYMTMWSKYSQIR